jgi:predicted dehydrogenase
MTSDTIGVALLGFGFAGRIFHAPFITTTPGLRLRVVASSQRSGIIAAYPDVRVAATPRDAIEADDVGLVVVATPNDTHAPLAEAALRAGRHVVVDKPFTVTLEQARGLAATADATGLVLSVFQNRRWDSDFLGISDAVRAGTIGDVVEFRSEMARWRPHVRDRWRERPGPGAGLWYDLGPHLVDQALELFGAPRAVQATLRTLRPGGETDDWFEVALDYPTRQVLVASSMLAADAPPRFVVRGTTGSLVKQHGDVQEERLLAGDRPGHAGWGQDDDPLLVLRDGAEAVRVPVPAGNYGQFYAAVHGAIAHGSRPPVPVAHAVLVMTIVTAAIDSSTTGRVVTVSEAVDHQP